MRYHLATFLCAILATAVGAESMAVVYYKQCTGPAMDRQARLIYETVPCHQTDTCGPLVSSLYETNVELSCYGNAVDICFVFDEYDACFREVVAAIEVRADTLAQEFPAERVQAAARLADGFLSRGLLRALERRHEQAAFDCVAPTGTAVLEEFGFTLDTYCDGLEALMVLDNERNISHRTVTLETENQ